MINYFYDCYRILNKVYSENAFIKQAILSTDIEEKNRAFTVKTCYGVLDKDIELSYYVKTFANKNPKLVIRTILKIAMYDIKYLQKKEYAVIDNAVELTKKLGKGGMSGFVNAFLRKFISSYNSVVLPKEISANFSVKYSFPEFAVKKLLKKYGEDRTEKILSYSDNKTTLAFYDIDGEDYLKKLGVEYEKTVFNNVFNVKNFVRNADYDNGIYTYQSLGSVAICDVVSPCDNLLDCCAAPGGKSVRLSYKCKNVVSCDLYEHRVALIDSYCKRMKRDNITAICKDSLVLEKDFIDKFDAVLCDAPCSGLGVTLDNPDIKLNRTEDNVKELTDIQLKILSNVSNYVKIGGNLYYSTCSILDDENYKIIEKFLKNNDNFVIKKIDSPLSHDDIFGTNAFLPDISGVGFYVCRLKRVK